MSCRQLRLLLPVLVPMALLAAADDSGIESRPIELPPFIVEESAKGPPWRYAEAIGYEVLSRCSDPVTQKVVDAHYRLYQLLWEILPERLQLTFGIPKALILYDEELQPAASREVIEGMLRGTSGPTAGRDEVAPPGGRRSRMAAPAARRFSFLPNLRLWDRDAMTVFMIVRNREFNGERLALTDDYIAYLVKNRIPALPAWFVSGFLAIYRDTKYEGDQLDVPPAQWISESFTAALKKDPQMVPSLIPLEDFFAGNVPQAGSSLLVDPIELWQAQARLLVRWGLDGRGAPRRAALWSFVERSAVEGGSEKLFEACFGFGYAAALEQLTAYRQVAVRNSMTFHPARIARLPALALRNASDGQIGRIKGDWERLEIGYVKTVSPDLAPKYLEQARHTLQRAYDRDERDPALLAVLGLCESDAGNDVRAREFLEAAARIGPMRPRACFELGRLRFADMKANAGGADWKLNPAQIAEVFTPLFAARAQKPPLVEVYELIADVWEHCAVTPTRGHLEVLDEGVRLFPRRSALVLHAAELHARHGYAEEAGILVRIGLHTVTDDAIRERLVQLQIQLDAAQR